MVTRADMRAIKAAPKRRNQQIILIILNIKFDGCSGRSPEQVVTP
jgi:hypothetical protein